MELFMMREELSLQENWNTEIFLMVLEKYYFD